MSTFLLEIDVILNCTQKYTQKMNKDIKICCLKDVPVNIVESSCIGVKEYYCLKYNVKHKKCIMIIIRFCPNNMYAKIIECLFTL